MAYYNYSDIEQLLNPQAKAFLKQEGNYTKLAETASDTVFEITGLAENEPAPRWLQMPFVWLLEYYAANTAAGISADQLARTKDNYRFAIDALEQHITTDTGLAPRVGSIATPYSIE